MNRDFDNDEKEFRREIDASLANLSANAGSCPHPDLIMAAAVGVEMENSGRILQHLNACPVCQQLVRDVAEHDFAGASEEEDRRIRARWNKETLPQRKPRRAWIFSPFVAGTAAAAILIAFALTYTLRETAPPDSRGIIAGNQGNPASTATPPTAKTRTAFVLTKAAIKVPTSAVLTVRSGEADSRAFLNDFASALEPYRNDDFAEAVRRLLPLSEKYRDSAEVHFYLGVSRLFLHKDSSALESLETARRLADDRLRDDLSWYLALALDRAGRVEDSRREIGALCSGAGEYQKRACAAQEEIK